MQINRITKLRKNYQIIMKLRQKVMKNFPELFFSIN
jgi:hypothetical protein